MCFMERMIRQTSIDAYHYVINEGKVGLRQKQINKISLKIKELQKKRDKLYKKHEALS